MSGNSRETLDVLLREAASRLRTVSETARLDVELLAREALGITREQLIMKQGDILHPEQKRAFEDFLMRREHGEPVAYIIGKKEFWSLEFQVTPAVLIPRPETELLVEQALEYSKRFEHPCIVDIGTGSGCIPISLAVELKNSKRSAKLIATDISSDALSVAKANADRLGVADMIEFRHGAWFDPLQNLRGAIDILISNPPYIAQDDLDVSPECSFEPQNALYSGTCGTEALEVLISNGAAFITPRGRLFLEFGLGQETFIKAHAAISGVDFFKDLAGITRIARVSFEKVT